MRLISDNISFLTFVYIRLESWRIVESCWFMSEGELFFWFVGERLIFEFLTILAGLSYFIVILSISVVIFTIHMIVHRIYNHMTYSVPLVSQSVSPRMSKGYLNQSLIRY